MKFRPTPRPNIIEIRIDIKDFTRELRLLHSFADEDDSNEYLQDSSNSLVRNKGRLNLPRTRSKVLDTVIDFLQKQILKKQIR